MNLKKAMLNERKAFGLVYDPQQQQIYALGGFNVSHYAECERYDVKKDEWKAIAPMNKARDGLSACFVDNLFIFVIGGNDGDKNVA